MAGHDAAVRLPWHRPTRPWWLFGAALWLVALVVALVVRNELEVFLSVLWIWVSLHHAWRPPTRAPGWWPERWTPRPPPAE